MESSIAIIIMPPCQKTNQKADVRSMSISSDFPLSVGDIPDRDSLRANLCCDYQKGDYVCTSQKQSIEDVN